MYRGDDIYLLDFWPLDEQNTVGGGADYRFGDTDVRLHVGVNRLNDRFQTQTIVVASDTVGTREVLFLDRQRTVTTLRAEHHFPLAQDLKLKVVVYGENHALPAGDRRTADDRVERLPSDLGWLGGAELCLYGFGGLSARESLLRYATGLAAFDEMGIPSASIKTSALPAPRSSCSACRRTTRPEATWRFGRRLRALLPRCRSNVYDREDAWELAWQCGRPISSRALRLIGEANLQYLRPNGLSPGPRSPASAVRTRRLWSSSWAHALGVLGQGQLQPRSSGSSTWSAS